MEDRVRILIVEDRLTDAELAQREIKQVLEESSFQRVETQPDFLLALDTFHPDVIVSDYKMPQFDGLTALKLALDYDPLMPVIILTGAINEETAVECMKAGAVDYVLKEQIKRLGLAVRHALEEKQTRREAEATRLKLEAQLRQAQKMESVGRLASGIAHDFNNLLTIILGYCALIQTRQPSGNVLQDNLVQIQRAGESAANLTRQLLAFSRKQILAPKLIDLNALVTDLHKMLERLIGEDIILATALQPDLRSIVADPGQIEQVIMNLVFNARDAMPTGGIVTLETKNIDHDGAYLDTHLEAISGPAVMLAITDTGHGMDRETLAKIFEPFFTTKEVGKGTGLGLSTVYGIIKQSGGDILVYSEPGRGTTIKIYLPANNDEVKVAPQLPPRLATRRGSETILLVEDDEMLRDLVRDVLQAEGYTILEAGNGHEGLALATRHSGAIELLLTDVVMPSMSGRELAEQLKIARPEIRVLYTSGYTDDSVIRHGLLAAEVDFLPKPFSPHKLSTKVRDVLDK